jgi:hypothetical protein
MLYPLDRDTLFVGGSRDRNQNRVTGRCAPSTFHGTNSICDRGGPFDVQPPAWLHATPGAEYPKLTIPAYHFRRELCHFHCQFALKISEDNDQGRILEFAGSKHFQLTWISHDQPDDLVARIFLTLF